MATHQEVPKVDRIPEDLPEDVRQRLLTLTEESGGMETIECSEPIIRHWCEAIEDANKLYLDDDYARSQGFDGIVAPPTIISTLAIPYRWPRGKGTEEAGPMHFRIKRIMNLPVGVIVDNETEFLRFIKLGDRLILSSRLVSLTGPKKTRIGEGYFWVIESTARNQRDEITSRSRMTCFAYDPGLPREAASAPDVFSSATEEALEADRCTHLPEDQHVYWDDVLEGDTLPTLRMPITVTRCIYLASGTRDFSPHHSNRDYAQEKVKARDMFLNTPFNSGILSRFATEWGGPECRLRKLKLAMRENICAGDDMVIDGTVSRKYSEGSEHFVDIDIQVSTQDGPAYSAGVTLLLPSRVAR